MRARAPWRRAGGSRLRRRAASHPTLAAADRRRAASHSHPHPPPTLSPQTTQDKNQYPVAFTDARNGFTEVYSNFAAQTAGSWPAGTFAKPASCA